MVNLAPLLYRKILAERGGPLERLELGDFPVLGRPMVQANAYLLPGLAPHRPSDRVYGRADGSGTAATVMLARFKAISEALERWAHHAKCRAADRELYGFDADESSSGMAAFPGLTRTRARHYAMLEAVERASLFSWWEGIADGERRATPWPDVSAVVVHSPINFGLTVIVWRRAAPDLYAFGHAAGLEFEEACERAVVELARHEAAVRRYREREGGIPGVGRRLHLFERRSLFFSTEAGCARFEERASRPPKGRRFVSSLICDTEIVGPWSKYATVWRALIKPPSREFLSDSENYFFW